MLMSMWVDIILIPKWVKGKTISKYFNISVYLYKLLLFLA